MEVGRRRVRRNIHRLLERALWLGRRSEAQTLEYQLLEKVTAQFETR